MWKWLIGLFLIAHGLVHVAVWASPKSVEAPFDPSRSWALEGVGVSVPAARSAGVYLSLLAAAVFVLGGLLLLVGAEAWRPVTTWGSVIGLAMAVVFFNPWLSFDVAINAGLLLGLTVWDWPTRGLVGS